MNSYFSEHMSAKSIDENKYGTSLNGQIYPLCKVFGAPLTQKCMDKFKQTITIMTKGLII
jgi:hypothetical protein